MVPSVQCNESAECLSSFFRDFYHTHIGCNTFTLAVRALIVILSFHML